MAKLRRKADIRQRAEAQMAARIPPPPRPGDWRLVFLEAIIAGASASRASQIAGISRARVYIERGVPEFDAAWKRAQDWRDMGFRNLAVPIWPPQGTAICGLGRHSIQRRATPVQR